MPEQQQLKQSRKPDSTFQKQASLTSQMHVSHPASIIQRARINPKSLTSADVLQLQRTIGNRAVGKLLSVIRNTPKVQQVPIQRQEIPEEETPQGEMAKTIQRQEIPEEEEPLQGKFENKPEKTTCPSCVADPIMQMQEIPEEEEPLQGKMADPVQRQEIPEEEEPLQGKMIGTIQRQEIPEDEEPLQTKRENNTGMPENLKAGVENLSGIDMSDVRVHYNSSKPAEVGALAYTQGTNIHVAPGQERHLPHEAWHVVQQKQGRVRPTMQMKGVAVNDDIMLEHEADVMGREVDRLNPKSEDFYLNLPKPSVQTRQIHPIIQRLGPNVAASDPTLVAQYNFLCNSNVFGILNRKVTTTQNITLLNSSGAGIANPPTDYNQYTHTIRVPVMVPPAATVPRPLADIREDILWEMHNASIRGAHTRTGNIFFAPLPANASNEERKKHPYLVAAGALSIEWDEWMNVVEHDIKAQTINNDVNMPGGAGIHVTRSFAPSFAVPNAGWYLFESYLNNQITQGHTLNYDPNANNPNWKGRIILNTVKTAAALRITQQQVADYISGRRRTVKSVTNNPFRSSQVIRSSMNYRH